MRLDGNLEVFIETEEHRATETIKEFPYSIKTHRLKSEGFFYRKLSQTQTTKIRMFWWFYISTIFPLVVSSHFIFKPVLKHQYK